MKKKKVEMELGYGFWFGWSANNNIRMKYTTITYLGGAFFTALLRNVLDLDQEITALLVEMEKVIKAVLLCKLVPICLHFPMAKIAI